MNVQRASHNRRFFYVLTISLIAVAGIAWLDTADYWKAKAQYDAIADSIPQDLQSDLDVIKVCNSPPTVEIERELQGCLLRAWPKIQTLSGTYILAIQTRGSIERHPDGKGEMLQAAQAGIDRAREFVLSPPSEVETAATRLVEASTNSFLVRAFSPRYLRKQWSSPQHYWLNTHVFFSAQQYVAEASK